MKDLITLSLHVISAKPIGITHSYSAWKLWCFHWTVRQGWMRLRIYISFKFFNNYQVLNNCRLLFNLKDSLLTESWGLSQTIFPQWGHGGVVVSTVPSLVRIPQGGRGFSMWGLLGFAVSAWALSGYPSSPGMTCTLPLAKGSWDRLYPPVQGLLQEESRRRLMDGCKAHLRFVGLCFSK